jgi:hypothetical protein
VIVRIPVQQTTVVHQPSILDPSYWFSTPKVVTTSTYVTPVQPIQPVQYVQPVPAPVSVATPLPPGWYIHLPCKVLIIL